MAEILIRWMETFPQMQQFSSCAVLERETYAWSVLPSPVDMKETFGWLNAANLPGASEGLVVAGLPHLC